MHAGCIAIRMHLAHIVFRPHPGVNASVECHHTKKANRTPYSTSFCDLMYARKKSQALLLLQVDFPPALTDSLVDQAGETANIAAPPVW